jgi:hypothetical protein
MAKWDGVFTVARGVALACGCATLSGCGTPTQPRVEAVGLVSLDVIGPTSAAPGQTLHYTAMARYSGGSSRDVTALAEWHQTSAAIRFTAPGVALATQSGEGGILASLDSPGGRKFGEASVLVLEPGTFKLTGMITEAGGSGPIGGMVEVLSGTGQGKQSGTSNSRYALYGVAGRVQLRASVANYIPQVHDVVVTDNGVTDDFALQPLEPPVDVAGAWTMTLAPSPSCPHGLPAVAHGRSYNVKLIQQGTRLVQVDISSPTLEVKEPSGISGWVSGPRLSLDFSALLDDFTGNVSTNLFDHLSRTDTLSIAGLVEGIVSGSPVAATLNGTLRYWTGASTGAFAWECVAKDHIVMLGR